MGWKDIEGYSGFLFLYEEAVKELPSHSTFVEVGVALGHSLAFLIEKRIEAGHVGLTFGVDPWLGYARNGEQQEVLGPAPSAGDFTLFLDKMRTHAPRELEKAMVLRATSLDAARMFENESIHFLLIDAAHDEESVERDIRAWLPKIAKGGWIAGDDHEPRYPGVEAACKSVFGDKGYEVGGAGQSTWFVKKGFWS